MQARQQRRHQHDRDDVARQTQDGPGEIAGAPGDVALGARQTIVPVGIIEVTEVEF